MNIILKKAAHIYGMENIEIPDVSGMYNHEKNNIYSFINFPIIINDALWGYVGISNLYSERKWKASDHHLFTLFSGLVSTSIRRNNTEQDLNKAEKTLRTVIDNISKGIFWKDVNSVYEGCNELYASMADTICDNIIGHTDKEIFISDYADRFESEDKIALSMNGPYHCEETIFNVKDSQKIVHITKSVVYKDEGKPIRIIGVVDDVTEIRLTQLQIEDTLNKLQAVMENFDGLVFCTDKKRVITIIGGASLIGADIANAVGRKISDVYNDYPIIVQSIEDTFRYGQQQFNYTEGNVHTQCSITPLKNTYGITTGILFMEIDISKQFYMQKQLEKAIIEAQRASSAKSEFLSRMSHEIRTPMNAIIGMTKIATASNDLERKQYCLNKIDTASKNLLELINQILDMSKIEADKLELTMDDFDFEIMLNEVCSVISVRSHEKAQKLNVNYTNEFPTIFIGDEFRLSQVITNLLSNAVKFTPEGGIITVNITQLDIKDSEAVIKVEVIDNGIGITKAQQTKLFNSFEQADGGIARKYGGSGLGLAICKKIVNLMNGNIWIESDEGIGSTFAFTVCLKQSELKAIDKNQEEELNYDFSDYTVLIVEDIDINKEIIIAILEDTKINIVCAENGKVALNTFIFEPDRFDIILMDLHMPEMDGYEATRRIRGYGIPKALRIPIIAMTANAFREDVEKCRNIGMNDHIAKPIDSKELIKKINKFIKI